MSQPPTPPEPPTQPQPQQAMQQPSPQQGTPPDESWPQYRPVPAQQPPKKVKRFGWPTVIITAVISLFVGMLFAFAGEPTTAVPEATATVPETENLPAEESSEPKTQEQDQPKAADTISDGTHEVGVDIKPGQYKTSVPEGELCF
jgi:cytoskeletal protein RodZ